ncbi:recombination mediator RecR [Teredinibacter franksiae]|jgi:recombination protein RecR|uniref:recombination mediator RecR n=1 Tax=Teredinibacter franksiae TaxID=2761453 RepID=UPI0016293384|nr:recombination mediator RecR [Teredinibacter franksiae]
MFSPLIDQLINALRVLPGVGPKSAQRMALNLLEHNRHGADHLATTLQAAITAVHRCQQCRTLTEQTLCNLCANPKRDHQLLCIVETPADVLALEQAGIYSGVYFVLLGKLSPIDGIGPKEIGIDLLEERFRNSELKELIIATNPTIEGEATSHYISERAKQHSIKVTRIAHGVPIGGELEYIDGSTLAHALNSRREV